MPDAERFSPRTVRGLLIAILLVYAVLGIGFAVRTPAWQAPDEPAHYNYVRQVAQNGCCPVIEAGDWDQAYLEQLTSARFNPDLLGRLDTLEYEDHQPPLYYLLATPIFALTGGNLLAIRLFGVLIGAGVVLAAYAVGRSMLPARPQIALGATVFVAYLPQHIAMLASANNDGLSELVIGIALLLMVRYLKGEQIPEWAFGALAGIGLLVKVNTLFLIGLIPLAILLRWRIRREPVGTLVKSLLLFALPALVLAGIWWARDVSVYGMPDIFGLRAHNAVVVGQPRTADLIAEVGFGEYLRRAAETTFNSFWGQFGWMALPLPGWTYALLLAFLAAALVGLLIDIFVLGRREDNSPGQRAAWAILVLTVLLAFAQYVYYNTEFLQFQGRYLYPMLIPVGIWLAVGFDAWRILLVERRAPVVTRWLAVGALGLLAPLSAYLLWRVIPLLAP